MKGARYITVENEVEKFDVIWVSSTGKEYFEETFDSRDEALSYISTYSHPDELKIVERMETVFSEELECREHDDA